MAILGNNVQGGGTFSAAAGRKASTKFTLASAQTLQELHAWVYPGSAGGGGNTYTIHIYADSSGSPGARVAYTSSIVQAGGPAVVEISQSGFSTALAAGDYWLGVSFTNAQGDVREDASTGTLKAILGGTTVSPPSDPYGTTDFGPSTGLLSVWAVTGAAATTPVADFTGTPLTGIWPLSVAFTDSSTNTPTSWAWTFGDGGTSTSQNPTHSYTTVGTYTVVLVATNAAGSNTKTRTGYVAVANPSGTLTKIKWGNRLVVTDEGGGVIRVDFV
jgi:PKD repeat protein